MASKFSGSTPVLECNYNEAYSTESCPFPPSYWPQIENYEDQRQE